MADAPELMRCMEVWGGNQPVTSAVVMAGLDAWVFSKPFGNAGGGGDVYYVSSCATGRITRLLLADVAGHGASVGELALALRRLMRQFVNQLNQTRFVRLMNSHFTALSEAGVFATAVVTTFFATNNQLSLCNAGHPPPLLYRASVGRWEFLERAASSAAGGLLPHDLPLGIADVFDYTEFEVRLRKGDMVLCYTDALIEARFPDGELLGTRGLLQIINGLDVSNPGELIWGLLAAIMSRTQDEGLARDDVTAMLFRANGDSGRTGWRKWAAAPIILVRGLIRSAAAKGEPIPWPDFTIANIGGAVVRPLGRLWRGSVTRR